MKVRLAEIAYARSGDKGSSANIGILAYSDQGFQFLRDNLTADKMAAYLRPLDPSFVERFELPTLWALNFVVKGVLLGGGSRSLRIDAQGKALGVAALEMLIEVPDDVYPLCRRGGNVR